ncbi:hypothetical protein ACQQ2Q_21430 [Agrobacterium sp. ES01]|uniref:hypothetical protein n=1 Tax=Agrobacterium sp. ES01 TaxID=3420714 RepID=UPI003D0CA8A0
MLMGMELIMLAFGLFVLAVSTAVAVAAWGMAKAYSQEFREEKQASNLALRIKSPPKKRKPAMKRAPEVMAA